MKALNISTCFDIYEGCPTSCGVEGADQVRFILGKNELELVFELEPFREFVTMSTRALAKMDDLYAQAEAMWEAEEAQAQAAERREPAPEGQR